MDRRQQAPPFNIPPFYPVPPAGPYAFPLAFPYAYPYGVPRAFPFIPPFAAPVSESDLGVDTTR